MVPPALCWGRAESTPRVKVPIEFYVSSFVFAFSATSSGVHSLPVAGLGVQLVFSKFFVEPATRRKAVKMAGICSAKFDHLAKRACLFIK